MKKLLVIAFLLAGCTAEKKTKAVSVPDPKFAYQQEVSITGGFLRGQSGKIVRYYPCNFRDRHYSPSDESEIVSKNGYCYDIKLKNDETWSNVNESEIL